MTYLMIKGKSFKNAKKIYIYIYIYIFFLFIENIFSIFSVIVSLKDAKAKVFEILNDLNQEKKAMGEIDIEIPR